MKPGATYRPVTSSSTGARFVRTGRRSARCVAVVDADVGPIAPAAGAVDDRAAAEDRVVALGLATAAAPRRSRRTPTMNRAKSVSRGFIDRAPSQVCRAFERSHDRVCRTPGRRDIDTAAEIRGRRRSVSRPRSRFRQRRLDQRVVVDAVEDLVGGALRGRVARCRRARICIRTRSLPALAHRRSSVRAMASATRASSIARSSRSRATASSMASGSWPLRASRWRTCSSDSSRRASIFRPSHGRRDGQLPNRVISGVAGDGLGHLVAAHLGGRRDALHLQLELVDVARPAQRLFVGDETLLEQAEDRLIERLHAVLRRARGDRAVDQVRLFLVDDAVADEGGADHHFDRRRAPVAVGPRHQALRDDRLAARWRAAAAPASAGAAETRR